MSRGRIRPGRYALLAGLAVSMLIHLLILLWNPTMTVDGPSQTGRLRAPTAPRGQLVEAAVREVVPQAAAPEQTRVSQGAPTTTVPVVTAATPGDSGRGGAVSVPGGRVDVDRGSALRYRAAPLWAPPPPRVETCAQRVRRELRERLAMGIADRTVGVPPPVTGSEKQRFEAGIRIPFGRKPPGPAIVVPPPPLPDSYRSVLKPPRDTINPPLFAADSLRCAAQDSIEALLRARPDTLVR